MSTKHHDLYLQPYHFLICSYAHFSDKISNGWVSSLQDTLRNKTTRWKEAWDKWTMDRNNSWNKTNLFLFISVYFLFYFCVGRSFLFCFVFLLFLLFLLMISHILCLIFFLLYDLEKVNCLPMLSIHWCG